MAKAKAKAASKLAKGASTLPAGYVSLDRPPNWDFEKQTILEGIRGPTEEVTVRDGKAGSRDQRCCVVEDETSGAVTLWESGMLRTLFDRTQEGDKIRVEFLGYGEPKFAGDLPTKRFTCGVSQSKSNKRNPF